MTMTIAGIGTAVPRHKIGQSEAAQIAQTLSCETAAQEKLLEILYRRTGVKSRHSVVLEHSDGTVERRQSFFQSTSPTTRDRMRIYESEAGSLACAAAAKALEQAEIIPQRVTHLVTVSCSGFAAPGFDILLIKQLHLPPETARTHVGFMGCHGALNGLRVAQAFVQADPSACVLVCAVELCSLHYQYGWDAEQIVANALFADGAAAVVGLADATSSDRKPHSHGKLQLIKSGSTWIENSEEAMSWRIGDHGFFMTLSPQVPHLICQHLRPWLEPWLLRQGLTISEVGSWAVHPGGPRILDAVGEALKLAPEALDVSRQVLMDYGNMSSPTVLFILEQIRQAAVPSPCVCLGFGPGLTIEAALLR